MRHFIRQRSNSSHFLSWQNIHFLFLWLLSALFGFHRHHIQSVKRHFSLQFLLRQFIFIFFPKWRPHQTPVFPLAPPHVQSNQWCCTLGSDYQISASEILKFTSVKPEEYFLLLLMTQYVCWSFCDNENNCHILIWTHKRSWWSIWIILTALLSSKLYFFTCSTTEP